MLTQVRKFRFEVNKCGVLYLALEDTERRLQERLEKLNFTGHMPDNFKLTTKWPYFNNGGIEALNEYLEKDRSIQLVIVDTLAKVRLPDKRIGNAYLSDSQFLSQVKAIADKLEIAIIIIHHLRKEAAVDSFDKISGTVGHTGTADTLIILDRARNQESSKMIITGRDVDEREINLQFQKDCTWRLSSQESKIVNLNPNEQSIIDFLTDAESPVRSKEIEQFMYDKFSLNVNTTRSVLSRLVKKCLIRRLESGSYTYVNTINQHNNNNTYNNTTTSTEATNTTRQQESLVGCVDLLPHDISIDCSPSNDDDSWTQDERPDSSVFSDYSDGEQPGSPDLSHLDDEHMSFKKCLDCRHLHILSDESGNDRELCMHNIPIAPEFDTPCSFFEIGQCSFGEDEPSILAPTDWCGCQAF